MDADNVEDGRGMAMGLGASGAAAEPSRKDTRVAAPLPDGAALAYDPKPGSVGVTVSFPDADSVLLEILAPAAEVAATLADARVSLARRCGLPDDAAGLAALDAQVDEAAASSYVAGFTLDHLAGRAFMRTGIMPFGTPDVTVDELPCAERDLSFTVRALVRPRCELSDYEGPVTIDVEPEASDADVDAWIDAMAASLAAQQAAGASGASDAAPATGTPGPTDAAPAAPSVPVIDDAWVAANMPEAGDLAGLRARVRTLLSRSRRAEALDACAAQLGRRLTRPVGERYVDARAEEQRDRTGERLAREGLTLEEFCTRQGTTPEAWERSQRVAARERLAGEWALDALADHLGLQVDEADLEQALTYASHALEPAAFEELAWYAETGQAHRLCEYALRYRAAEWLLARASIAQG